MLDVNKETKVEEAWIGLHGRILRCPLGNNPEDCPLHDIRKMSVEDRLAWLNSKTNKEVLELFGQHIDCLEHKSATSSSRPCDTK